MQGMRMKSHRPVFVRNQVRQGFQPPWHQRPAQAAQAAQKPAAAQAAPASPAKAAAAPAAKVIALKTKRPAASAKRATTKAKR